MTRKWHVSNTDKTYDTCLGVMIMRRVVRARRRRKQVGQGSECTVIAERNWSATAHITGLEVRRVGVSRGILARDRTLSSLTMAILNESRDG